MKSPKIACYLRVSSTCQTLDSQTAEIDRWLANHGIVNPLTFTDKSTGDNLARPGFQALQKAIFAGEVQIVVVYKLDRLSRTLRDGIATLCDWLDRGVRVVAVSQQFDFHGPTGKLIAAVLLAVAEMEQETRRERQAAGIDVAKQAGKYTGRKPGSTKRKPSRARSLQAEGLAITDIANRLGVSRQTVYRYLS